MLENRKILTAVFGYIIGIIMGLYCKISIVLLYLIFYVLYLIFSRKQEKKQFQLFSFKRYIRYVKIIFNKQVIKIIIIFSIIANTIVLFQNNRYENLYKNLEGQNCKLTGIVIAKQEDKYKVKITIGKYKNTYLYMYLDQDIELEYGDQIIFNGTFTSPKKRSNYKGFDYAAYLKTLKIHGTIKAENVKIVAKNKGNIFVKYANQISFNMQEKIDTSSLSFNQKAILKGILLGNITDISDEILNQFSESSILHILSVSGMNISYIILIVNFIFSKCLGKHYAKIITSIAILFYMGMVNFTPSIVRAGITGIAFTLSNFFYRKNDVWQSLGLALFIILMDNPFLIQSVGLQLSFAGTIGILIFQKNLKKWVNDSIDRKNRKAIRRNQKILKWILKLVQSKIGVFLLDAILVTISATVAIMPILLITFHNINVTSLSVSVLSSFIIGPIMAFGFLIILFPISLLENILKNLLNLLIGMVKWGSELPFHQIYLITPSIFFVIFYYGFLFILNLIITIKLEKKPDMFQKRIKNLMNLFKYKIKSKQKKIISILCMISLCCYFISMIPKNLKIYFVDVGQGDCTLIVTPKNKSILIDGGGSDWADFDVRRENTHAIFI